MKIVCVVLILAVFAMVSEVDGRGEAYCAKCKFHTMCETTSPGARCKDKNFKSMPLTDAEKREILHTHNRLRNKIAKGEETRGSPGPQFGAANMMKMVWDNELGKIAQRLADQCYWIHDCNACRLLLRDDESVGQTSYFKVESDDPTKVDYTALIESVFNNEVARMNREYVKEYVKDESGDDWDNYSQMVWWNSRLVGCGTSSYDYKGKNMQHVFCNYRTSGNVEGAKMYEVGAPGSQCPEGTATSNPKYEALCVIQNEHKREEFPTDGVILGVSQQPELKCERRGFRRYE